jgi:hypothetical protein
MFKNLSSKLFMGGKTAAQRLTLIWGIATPWAILLLYCLPAIFLGAKNLAMVRYFDQDEYLLVEYGFRLYQQGIVPGAPASGYPKAFNYLCGLFLYPYTFFFGPDAEMVTLTFRWVNTIAMALTIVLINIIGIRFFRSYLVGAVAAILFVLTPDYPWWTVNSRPHPVEIFLIILSIYYCLKAFETRQKKTLWTAAVWAGLAFGTKLGGLWLIPILGIVYGYLLWQENPNREQLKPEYQLGRWAAVVCLAAGVTSIAIVYNVLFHFKRSSTGLTTAQKLGWQQGLASFPFNYGLMAGVGCLALGAGVFWLNRKMARHYDGTPQTVHLHNGGGRPLVVLFAYKIICFWVKVVFIFGGMFLLTNFDYLIYPKQNLFGILWMVFWTTLSTRLTPDTNYFIWLDRLSDARCLGIGGTLLVFYYFATELWQWRAKLTDQERQQRGLRLLCLAFSLILVFFLVVGVQHRPHHYLLPALPFFFLLGVDALCRTVRGLQSRHLRYICVALCVVLAFFYIEERLPEMMAMRTALRSRDSDTVLTHLAPYLTSTYPDSVSIMTDDLSMYIPDRFANLTYWKAAWRGSFFPGFGKEAFRTLADENPKVFVRGDFFQADTTWSGYRSDVEYLDARYSIVKRIPYQPKARISKQRDVFVVYERKPFDGNDKGIGSLNPAGSASIGN